MDSIIMLIYPTHILTLLLYKYPSPMELQINTQMCSC